MPLPTDTTVIDKEDLNEPEAVDVRSDVEAAFKEHTEPKPKEDAEPADEGVTAKTEDKPAAKTTPDDKTAPVTTDKTAEPLQNWSAKDKETFKALPPAAQQFLLAREKQMTADYTRKTQEIASFKKDYEPVHALLSPHYEAIKARGMTPASLIQAWANVEDALVKGGPSALDVVAKIVQAYKIDPAALNKALGAPAGQQQQQPAEQPTNVSALPPEVLKRLDDLDQFRTMSLQERQQQAQQQRQQQETQVMDSIEKFKGAVDKDGNLLHPHFDAVEEDMTGMVMAARQLGRPVPDLDALYELAVHANPETRKAVLAAMKQSEEKARNEATRQRSANARKAGSSVTGAPGPGQATNRGKTPERSIREELDAAMSDLSS